jgi:RES domain-containing protein
LRAYRFVSTRFGNGLSPEGARLHGGRWSNTGVAVLYCAASESLALLELRVHAPHPYPRTRFRFVLEIPDDAVAELPVRSLPREWK